MSFTHFLTLGHFAPGAVRRRERRFVGPIDLEAAQAVLARYPVPAERSSWKHATVTVDGSSVRLLWHPSKDFDVNGLARELAEALGCDVVDLEHALALDPRTLGAARRWAPELGLPTSPLLHDRPALLRVDGDVVRAVYDDLLPELVCVAVPERGAPEWKRVRLDPFDPLLAASAGGGCVLCASGSRVFWKTGASGPVAWRDLDGPARGVLDGTGEFRVTAVSGDGTSVLLGRDDQGSQRLVRVGGAAITLPSHRWWISWSGRWLLRSYRGDLVVVDARRATLPARGVPNVRYASDVYAREQDDFVAFSYYQEVLLVDPATATARTVASAARESRTVGACGDAVLLRDGVSRELVRIAIADGSARALAREAPAVAALGPDGRALCVEDRRPVTTLDGRGSRPWNADVASITHGPVWSRDGRRLAVTCAGGAVYVIDRTSLDPVEWSLEGCDGPVAFAADGRTLWGADGLRGLVAWDLTTGHESHRGPGFATAPRSLLLSPDGRWLLDPTGDALVRLDGNVGELTLLPYERPLFASAFGDDGDVLCFSVAERSVEVERFSTDGDARAGAVQHLPVTSLDFLLGQLIPEACAASAGARLYDGELERLLSTEWPPDAAVVFGPTMQVLLRHDEPRSSSRTRLRVTDRASGEVLFEATLPDGRAWGGGSPALSPDERSLAFLNARNELVVYGLPSSSATR